MRQVFLERLFLPLETVYFLTSISPNQTCQIWRVGQGGDGSTYVWSMCSTKLKNNIVLGLNVKKYIYKIGLRIKFPTANVIGKSHEHLLGGAQTLTHQVRETRHYQQRSYTQIQYQQQLVVCGFPHLMSRGLSSSLKTITTKSLGLKCHCCSMLLQDTSCQLTVLYFHSQKFT